MSLCEKCVQGVKHEGHPTGKVEEIGGVKSYVATPTGEYAKDTVILYLPDIFGFELVNNKLNADSYAANGFKTVIPDLFHGDAAPAEGLGAPASFDFMTWIKTHGAAETRPPLDAVVGALRAAGVSTFGAVGYCFGARYAVDLALENVTKAVAMAHPSLLNVPADWEALKAKSNNPILINSCEDDFMFGLEKQATTDEVLGGGQYAPGYERTYWEGCSHGYSVRGDLTDPKVKAGSEGTFKATVEFFRKHL